MRRGRAGEEGWRDGEIRREGERRGVRRERERRERKERGRKEEGVEAEKERKKAKKRVDRREKRNGENILLRVNTLLFWREGEEESSLESVLYQ